MALFSFIPDIYLIAGGAVVAVLLVLLFFLKRRKAQAQVQQVKPVGHRDRTVESLERIAGALEAFSSGGSTGSDGRVLRLAEQYEAMAKMGLTSGIAPADVAKSIRNAVNSSTNA